MAQGFSSTDAAFAGLRLTRERPGLVLALSGVTFAGSLASGLALTTLAPDAAARVAEVERAGDSASLEQISSTMAAAAPAMVVNIPLLLLVFGVVFAALYRALVTPMHRGRSVGFGMPELRQSILIFVNYALFVLLAMVVSFLVQFVGGTLNILTGGSAKTLLGILAYLALPIAMIYFGVRLSLAGSQTFYENKLRVFGSWRLTHKKVGLLLGSYVLALALAIVVSLLILTIGTAFFAIFALSTGGTLADLSPNSGRAPGPGDFLQIETLIRLSILAVVQVLFVAIAIGPAAEAFRTFGDAGGAFRTADPVKRTYDATV